MTTPLARSLTIAYYTMSKVMLAPLEKIGNVDFFVSSLTNAELPYLTQVRSDAVEKDLYGVDILMFLERLINW